MLRRFADYMSSVDPRTEVPPQGLLPHRYFRKNPYLYSDAQINDLIRAARQIPSPTGLRAASYSTLFGLLAVTGMRLGEALGLNRQEVDLDRGVLRIRQAKFNKSRLVPIHSSTRDKLQQYQDLRDQIFPVPETPAFLSQSKGPD